MALIITKKRRGGREISEDSYDKSLMTMNEGGEEVAKLMASRLQKAVGR